MSSCDKSPISSKISSDRGWELTIMAVKLLSDASDRKTRLLDIAIETLRSRIFLHEQMYTLSRPFSWWALCLAAHGLWTHTRCLQSMRRCLQEGSQPISEGLIGEKTTITRNEKSCQVEFTLSDPVARRSIRRVSIERTTKSLWMERPKFYTNSK